jgi:hypothetical protein
MQAVPRKQVPYWHQGSELHSQASQAMSQVPSRGPDRARMPRLEVSFVAPKDLQELVHLWILSQGGVQRETHQGPSTL